MGCVKRRLDRHLLLDCLCWYFKSPPCNNIDFPPLMVMIVTLMSMMTRSLSSVVAAGATLQMSSKLSLKCRYKRLE